MLKLGKTRARGSRVGSRMEQIHPAGVKVGKGGRGTVASHPDLFLDPD